MKKIAKTTALIVVLAAAGTASVGAVAGWGEGRGSCQQAEKHDGHGRMMKHMGGHGRSADRALDLTAEEVRTLVQARMIMRGNDRLKVGQVQQQNDDTYLVDVVTVDDSLVRQVEIDRETGFPRGPAPAEK